MSGALAIYQGWVCTSVRLVRTRGFSASLSQVEFHVLGYPGALTLEASTEVAEVNVDAFKARLLQGRTISGSGDALPQPGILRAAGELVLLEVDQAGKLYQLRVRPLYVVKVETARRSNRGAVSRIRVTLADARLRWDRGGMTRWSWNRYRANGTLAHDSLKAGQPYRWDEVAGEVVGALHGAPALGRSPARFAVPAGPFQLPPFPAAVEALGQLARDHHLSDPCLAWSGSVGLWEPGEGRLAASTVGEDGRPTGTENVQELPPELVLDKQGTGKGHTVEFAHPPEVVIVVAGPRIATIALDDCEPCLVVEGRLLQGGPPEGAVPEGPAPTPGPTRIMPLTEDGRGEATVRKLTNGRFGLDWLKVWILGPRSHQDVPGLSRDVAQLFASQAWRVFRLPGVEVPLTPGAEDTEAGPNAHLLPLLERAETTGGRRLPVTVEAYSFSPVSWELRGEGLEEDARRVALRKLATLKRQILAASAENVRSGAQVIAGALGAAPRGPANPFDGPEIRFGDLIGRSDAGRLTPGTMRDLLSDAGDLFTSEELAGALNQAQTLRRIGTMVSEGFVAPYEQALKELYAAEAKGRDVLLDAAKEVLALEKQLEEDRNAFESVEEQLQESSGLRDALKAKIRQQLLAVRRAREEEELRSRLAGGTPRPARPRAAITHKNHRRSVDAGAVVMDPELGLIRTSRLAGWLFEPAVPVAASTKFVPKAVRVLFGATLRPKVSRPITQSVATAPGSGGGENRVTDVLGDDESFFTAWYRRVAGQVSFLDPGTLDPKVREQLRREAVTLRHPELGPELIPLGAVPGVGTSAAAAALARAAQALAGTPGGLSAGAAAGALAAVSSNADQLRLAAEQFARPLLLRQERVEEARLTLGRPWAVNCDGVVAGVEIRSRPDMKGFETVIVTGSSAPAIEPMRTREHPRARDLAVPDAAAREGGRA